MSMIDTNQVRMALLATTKASGLDETFYDILVPTDDGRTENPLMIGQLFGVDLVQHPDVPPDQMHIKRKPAVNYKPQAAIADLRTAREVLVDLGRADGMPEEDASAIEVTLAWISRQIVHYQKQIKKGDKS